MILLTSLFAVVAAGAIAWYVTKREDMSCKGCIHENGGCGEQAFCGPCSEQTYPNWRSRDGWGRGPFYERKMSGYKKE